MKDEELFTYKLKGYCCSQIIMAAYLERTSRENPDLIKAMGGLCIGSQIENLCGTLSAAICVMTLAAEDGDTGSMCEDLSDWFEDTYGSLQCREIINGDPLFKAQKCPMLIQDTFRQMEEILDMNGKLPW